MRSFVITLALVSPAWVATVAYLAVTHRLL
jgi:hypothetical protein